MSMMSMMMPMMGMGGMMAPIINMMAGMMNYGFIVPALIVKIIALKGAILIAPKLSAGIFLFGQGATLICMQLMWKIMQYKRIKLRARRLRVHRHRVTKYGGGGWAGPGGHHHTPVDTLIQSQGWARPRPDLRIGSHLRSLVRKVQSSLIPSTYRIPSAHYYSYAHAPPPPWQVLSALAASGHAHGHGLDLTHSAAEQISKHTIKNYIDKHVPKAKPGSSVGDESGEPLGDEDYAKLMAWTKGQPLDLQLDEDHLNSTLVLRIVRPTQKVEEEESATGATEGENGLVPANSTTSTTVKPSSTSTSAKVSTPPPTSSTTPYPLMTSTAINLRLATPGGTQLIPITITRIKRKSSLPSPSGAPGAKSRRLKYSPAGAAAEADDADAEILKDVENFFTIMSMLDEHNCLQKLVCEIHASKSKSTSGGGKPSASAYETHVLKAFKILETLGINKAKNSKIAKKFIQAARFGKEIRKQQQLQQQQERQLLEAVPYLLLSCQDFYSSCPYNKDELIGLGNRIPTDPARSS